jgi:hypothetical protein
LTVFAVWNRDRLTFGPFRRRRSRLRVMPFSNICHISYNFA